MALCKLSSCAAAECKTSVGGANRTWFINWDDIIQSDVTLDVSGGDEDGAITDWVNSGAVDPLLYPIPAQFETLGGGFSFANPQSANAQYFNHQVQLIKPGITQKDLNIGASLKTGKFVVIIETRTKNDLTDNENVHLVFGLENGLTLETGDSQIGLTKDDLPGDTLVWSGGHEFPPREIRPAAGTIAELLGALNICDPAA